MDASTTPVLISHIQLRNWKNFTVCTSGLRIACFSSAQTLRGSPIFSTRFGFYATLRHQAVGFKRPFGAAAA
jgi:hypothetical protein